jgi:hypothetical protein
MKEKNNIYNKAETFFLAASSSSGVETLLSAFFFPFTDDASSFRDVCVDSPSWSDSSVSLEL